MDRGIVHDNEGETNDKCNEKSTWTEEENERSPIKVKVGIYTAISIKVVSKQSGKVEYEREKLAWSDD